MRILTGETRIKLSQIVDLNLWITKRQYVKCYILDGVKHYEIGDISEKTGLQKTEQGWRTPKDDNDEQSFIMTDKQFGKKIGKHAGDYGLNPASAEDREKLEHIILDIIRNPEYTVEGGEWRGQPGKVTFKVKNDDVVVLLNGTFVTVLKGGINNARFKSARDKNKGKQ